MTSLRSSFSERSGSTDQASEAALQAAQRRKGNQIGGSLLTLLRSQARVMMHNTPARAPRFSLNAIVWENSVVPRSSAAHKAASEPEIMGRFMRAGS